MSANDAFDRDATRQRKRELVLREAAAAFRRRGYHNTSLDDVARALRISKPALYYYFSNKHEIPYECHKRALDIADAIAAELDLERSPALDALTTFIGRYVAALAGDVGHVALLAESACLEGPERETIMARRDGYDRLFQGIIERGMADGSIRQVEPRIAIFFFMGAVNWLGRWYDVEGAIGPETLGAGYADMVRHALAA